MGMVIAVMTQGLPSLTAQHALLLDFDGTLVDIAPRPDGVRVSASLLESLRTVQTRLDGALAIVTGRDLDDIDHFLSPLHLVVASEHGARVRMHSAVRTCSSGVGQAPDINEALRELRPMLATWPALLVETKHASVALHYREAKELESHCLAAMRRLALRMPGTEVLRGKCVVELKPIGNNKGRAVRQIMQHAPFEGRIPVFVGDDVTDESAFEVTTMLGGISVKVGPGPTMARHRCANAQQVRTWLTRQARAAGPLSADVEG